MDPKSRRGLLQLSLLAVAACVAGCASWSSEQEPTSEPSLLPTRRLKPDNIIVETVLVRFSLGMEPDLNDVWRQANESILDMELRRRLDKNGIRAGVLQGELPQVVRERLDATAAMLATDVEEYAGLASNVDNKMRQLQCRAGRRKELLVKREVSQPLTILTTLDGQRISGETYEKPSLMFDLRALPHGDGSATIELTPEVQHGDFRQTFVTTDFGVRPEARRGQQVWPQLKVATKLAPGQVLVISTTFPPKAVGQAFFVAQTRDQTDEYVMLLLRISQTQLDELFAPDVIDQANALTEH